MKKIVILSLFIFIILNSCDNVSDFLFETEQTIEIRSINNGSLYKGGESFPITIYFDRAIVPDEMSVTIFDDQGSSWGETLIPIPNVEDEGEFLTSLIIPEELPQGKYIFHIRVFESSMEILFKDIIIFKTDSDFSIDQLYSLPHETKSGKDVFIKAEVNAPQDIDSYLRWTLNDEILNEGYLSDGLDTLYWIAAEENGLYNIRLEVFPEWCDSSFLSSVFATTEIVVTDEPLIEKNSLIPEDDYSLLFHFSGDYLPVNESEFETTIFGELNVETINNILGYSFSENSGISVAGQIIPQDSGMLTPFSINGRISLLNDRTSGNLLNASDGQEEVFTLTVNDLGNLVFSMNDQESVSLFSITEIIDFTVHVIPRDDFIEIRWFYNGNKGGSDYLDAQESTISDELTLLIGGNAILNSADLFIDELGIFTGQNETSSIDSSQFQRVKKYHLGESLIAADGQQIIQPGSRLLLSDFFQTIKDTAIVLSFPIVDNGDSWTAYLTDEEEKIIYQFTNNDVTQEIDIQTGLISNKARLSLVVNENSLDFELLEKSELDKNVLGVNPGDKLSLFFETNVENKNVSILDFYIIYTNVDSIIPQMVVTVEEEESLL